MKKTDYYTKSAKDTLTQLNSRAEGLSNDEAKLRLDRYGLNSLPEEKKLSALSLFLNQFKNPLIYILVAAFLISILTKHIVDAGIIFTVILVSSLIGFFQEYKADKALSQLKKLVKYKARVIRNGVEVVVAQEKLVPGDIVLLKSGSKIPADARLIEVNNLEVIEAALSGESVPSTKITKKLDKNTPLADRENMVYQGTVVAKGKAKAVITATGTKTELGKIASLVKETKQVKTPLQKQLTQFGKVIGLILVGLNILIFIVGVLTGRDIYEMFLTSVAIVVAAVPEGLLPAMTVILAIGMQGLAKKNGLVRRILASETLGSISVICSDKTGTLTKGEMRVSDIITETSRLSLDNTKTSHNKDLEKHVDDIQALKIGLLCNDAKLDYTNNKNKSEKIIGAPTEKALYLAAQLAGLDKKKLDKNEPRIAEIPFDSEYKYMATLHQKIDSPNQEFTIYAKGAPEKIFKFCSSIEEQGKNTPLTPKKRKELIKKYEDLTKQGLRVLAVAYKTGIKENTATEFSKENLKDLTFVGLIGIKDPLRPKAKETIALTQKAGIRPIIITGDHKMTAKSIALDLGLKVTDKNIFEGSDIDELTDEQLMNTAKEAVIFARVEPKHKSRIISSLQANGEVVAMTGDGVNDAPALKRADIGVAVGSGTDVTKETADLVLLDNNFRTIVGAIEYGRIIYNNIRKVIIYLVTDAFSELTIVTGSILLGLPLPILPAQILWIKLVEDTGPAMSLSFDKVNEDVMKDPPRKKKESILNNRYKLVIFFYAIIMDTLLLGLFYYFIKSGEDLDYARTIVFAGLGLASLFDIYAIRGLKSSVFKINPFSNKYLTLAVSVGIILSLVAIYVPFFNKILHTVPLGIMDLLIVGVFGVLSIFVYEIFKYIFIIRARNSARCESQ